MAKTIRKVPDGAKSSEQHNYPKVEYPRLEKLKDTGTIHNRLAIA